MPADSSPNPLAGERERAPRHRTYCREEPAEANIHGGVSLTAGICVSDSSTPRSILQSLERNGCTWTMLQPPQVDNVLVTFPAPHVLLVTLNRPSRLNAIPPWQHADLERLFTWFDHEPSLRCAIITGSGRAFCVGADLKAWNERHGQSRVDGPERWRTDGFGGLSNRVGKKPIVAAVNGLCLGGGMEMVINCDLVIASRERAWFGLPEARRGVVANTGALPRLVRTVGKQRASEMVLLGGTYDAQEMKNWGLVNVVLDDLEGREADVVGESIRMASQIAANSPDSIITSREGLRLGWEPLGPKVATEVLGMGIFGRMDGGDNMKEGLASFVEKREPAWKNSKL